MFTKTTLNLILLIALTGVTAFLLQQYIPSFRLIEKFWVVFGFLAVLTLIAYFASVFGIRKGGESSVLILMGALGIKLVFSMVFALIYILKFKPNHILFAGEFFSLYFLFTAFEVHCLLCNLRPPK